MIVFQTKFKNYQDIENWFIDYFALMEIDIFWPHKCLNSRAFETTITHELGISIPGRIISNIAILTIKLGT